MKRIITAAVVGTLAAVAFSACDTGTSDYKHASDKSGHHAKATKNDSAPDMTTGQKAALESAQSYLSMGGFSRAGLIGQLTSKAGEGFTPAQAAFAAHKVGY